ncbi:TPA: hypothetical protein ACPT3S_005888, partial [Klebsiella pneumoniae]
RCGPAKHSANRDISGCAVISPGGGCALPGLRGLQAIFASQARQALRRRAIYRRHTRHFAGWRLRLTRPTGYTGDLRFPGPASAAPPGNLSAPYPPFRRVAAAPYPA